MMWPLSLLTLSLLTLSLLTWAARSLHIVTGSDQYTGYGTLICNYTANSKTPKLVKVDNRLKQRVLAYFLRREGRNVSEIQGQMGRHFGGEAIRVDDPETSEEMQTRIKLHYNLVERVIIQFLTAQGVRPSVIYKRLRAVSEHGQHMCNVYRWTHKFRGGRTNVANLPINNTVRRGRRQKFKNIMDIIRLATRQ